MRNAGQRRVAFVSVGRSDNGIIGPVVAAMRQDSRFDPVLILTGDPSGRALDSDVGVLMEVSVSYGDGTPLDMSAAIAQVTGGIAEGLSKLDDADWPDMVLLTGDRFEMLAVASALVPLNIPLCHLHGGEISAGAIDDAIRHALTKFSHLHFTATEEAAARLRQLGEEPWRITVSGAPALDNLQSVPVIPQEALAADLGFPALADGEPILVTLHAETRDGASPAQLATAVLGALSSVDAPLVFTHPNADPGGRMILSEIEAFCAGRDNACVVESLGTERYFSLMKIASVMVGNSSSGLIEAPSFGLPVVNVGDRQQGRQRGVNVVDCSATESDVRAAMECASAPSFRQQAKDTPSPFGDGRAAERILKGLAETALDNTLLSKKFVDLP